MTLFTIHTFYILQVVDVEKATVATGLLYRHLIFTVCMCVCVCVCVDGEWGRGCVYIVVCAKVHTSQTLSIHSCI